MRRQLLPALRMVARAAPSSSASSTRWSSPGSRRSRSSDKADGSLVERDGKVVGSSLLGQTFTGDRVLPRPALAAGAGPGRGTDGGDPVATTRDRPVAALGRLEPRPDEPRAARRRSSERVAAYREANGLGRRRAGAGRRRHRVGSGLDPHISVANARLQAPRVADGTRASPVDEVLDARRRAHRAAASLGSSASRA